MPQKYIMYLVALILTLASTMVAPLYAQQKSEPIELFEGMQLDRRLDPSVDHIYIVQLISGSALKAIVTQQGIDVVIDVYAPNGQLMKRIDETGAHKQETIIFTALQTGMYQLVVHAFDTNARQDIYTLKIDRFIGLTDNAERVAKKEYPTRILYDLWQKSLTDNKAVTDFVSQHEGRYITEKIPGNEAEMLVTYFTMVDDDTDHVLQAGGPDFYGLRLRRLGNTQFFFVTQVVPNDARFIFGFNFFKIFKAGPTNEVVFRKTVHGYDGTVVMPMAPSQPYLQEKEGMAKGTLESKQLSSSYLDEKREITVYTPPNYDNTKPHKLLIIFDGEVYSASANQSAEWESWVQAPTILDNLITENKIQSTVTIFVNGMGKRNQDMPSEDFADFIALELVPWSRTNFNIKDGASSVVVAGSSRGGFAAANIAFIHPSVIGNVLSQSGSFWIKGTSDENNAIYPRDTGKLITAFKNSGHLPIRFYMEVGLYDLGAGMLGTNRQLRDILHLKGYEVDYREFNGGHAYANWRVSLSDGLISLLGAK